MYLLSDSFVCDFNNEDFNVDATAVMKEDNVWEINGVFTIEEANEMFGTTLSDEDHDTLSGLIFSKLGTIPSDGEQFEIEISNLKIHVKEIKDHRVEKMIISIT